MSSHVRRFRKSVSDIAESGGGAFKMRRDKAKARKTRKITTARASDAVKADENAALQAQADATLNQGQRTTTRGQSARLGGEPITSRRRLS